ncbi:MAG: FtsB family cell division protein [bacterium]
MSRPFQRTRAGRAVIVIVVLAALGLTLAIPLREWLAQRAEISALSEEVGAAKERVDALEKEAADWEDPAYVVAQARTRLHFVFPGEIGHVVLGADDRPIDAVPQDEGPPVAWYSRLWASTREADGVP